MICIINFYVEKNGKCKRISYEIWTYYFCASYRLLEISIHSNRMTEKGFEVDIVTGGDHEIIYRYYPFSTSWNIHYLESPKIEK